MCIRELPDPQRTQKQIGLVRDAELHELVRQCVMRAPDARPTMSDVITVLTQQAETLNVQGLVTLGGRTATLKVAKWTLCMKVLLCVSQLWKFSSKKLTFFADGVSSWETLGSSSPLRIHLLTKKTGSSQDLPGSYYLINSHLEQLQGACHKVNET